MKKIAITIALVAALNSGRVLGIVVGEDLKVETTSAVPLPPKIRPLPPKSGATGVKRSQPRKPPIVQKKQHVGKTPKKVVVETKQPAQPAQPAKPLLQRGPREPVYPTPAKPTCRCLKGRVYSSETTQAACSAAKGTWRCMSLR